MSRMGYVATFDVGTTAIKSALVDDEGNVLVQASSDPMPINIDGDCHEQDPRDWWHSFVAVSQALLSQAADAIPGFRAEAVRGIIMSGQMQDVIALDAQGSPVRDAILYSDGRAEAETHEITGRIDARRFHEIVGNPCEGSLPLPKLMWIARHEPDTYAQIRHVLIDAKDYIVLSLTGEYIGDVTACSTAGALDIRSRLWCQEILKAAGVDAAIMPELHRPQDVIGSVSPDAAEATGFMQGTPVYAGIGDAGAATLASGVTRPGQYNIHLGTSGWVAAVSAEPIIDKAGVANLACDTPSGYINGVPFLNAGNVHRWAAQTFADGSYETMGTLLDTSPPGARGVLCLPYLVGERFPVMNPSVRGAFIGISPDTTTADMARAALEAVAFSIRQGLETFTAPAEEITLIGGGVRQTQWCQIMADVLGRRVEAFRNADIMPAVALAGLVMAPSTTETQNQTTQESSKPLSDLLQSQRDAVTFDPNPAAIPVYQAAYQRFRQLYPAIGALNTSQ